LWGVGCSFVDLYIHILKSEHTVTFYSKYSRALTFENVCLVLELLLLGVSEAEGGGRDRGSEGRGDGGETESEVGREQRSRRVRQGVRE